MVDYNIKLTLDGREYKPTGLLGLYVKTISAGMATGGILGFYIGTAVGVASPIILGYSAFKVAKMALRK